MTEIGLEAEFAIEEPSLCLHRLGYDCTRICEQAEISCVAAHSKFIVLGHVNGAVNVFDHLGDLVENGSYRKHFRPINQLGISEDGNFVVSCADDGFVFIYNLAEPKKNELINVTRPVKSVAIAPNYLKTSKIVTADKTISLHSRGVFGRRITERLYSPPGIVQAMIWRGDTLIWADSGAVRIYSVCRRQLINYVPRPATQADNLEGPSRCQLVWHSSSCFLIGWDKTLQVCHILHPPKSQYDAAWSSAASNDETESVASSSLSHFSNTTVSLLPKQFVKMSAQINVGSRGIICGLATHQNRLLVLLYPPRSIESLLVITGANCEEERRPQILVADVGEALTNPNATGGASDVDSLLLPEGEDAFEEISLEDVEIKCPPNRGLQGLGLVSIPCDEAHFIYSPTDIIYAQGLSADDRIDWFLKQDIPKRALQIAKENRNDLVRHSFQKLGMDYLEKLLGEGNYQEAAALCKQILPDQGSWEVQIHRFLQSGELHTLVPYLPASPDMLSPGVYEIILIELLNKSPRLFLQKLNDWPPKSGLYSLESVIGAVVQRTSSTADQDLFEVSNTDVDMGALWRAMVMLYEASGQLERSLEVALRLKDSSVFDLLSRHLVLSPPSRTSSAATAVLNTGSAEDPTPAGLFVAAVGKHLLELCQIDLDAAVSVMLDCVKDLPVDFVVHELDPQPQLLFKYLSALKTRHPRLALPYAQRLVQLYAAYARDQLLAYLRSTHEYPLNEALALCQSLGFVPETVYLLTRVGRRKDALRLLMEKGADDALLLGNRDLTPEQRQAEIAAQAIAYCLEEDYCSGSGGVFLTYDTSASNNPCLRRAAHRRLLLHKRSRAGSTGTEEGEEEEEEREDVAEGLEGSVERSVWNEREAGELWRQVVLFAVDKPGFICALLRHASTERIDPSLLLRKISPEMEIPCLKESLMTMLRNTKMQIELRRNCLDILLKDLHVVSSRLVQGQNRGIFVDLHKQQAHSKASDLGSNACRVCRSPLLAPSAASGETQSEMGHQPSLVVFRCSHVFHRDCVLQKKRKSLPTTLCPVCVQERTAAA